MKKLKKILIFLFVLTSAKMFANTNNLFSLNLSADIGITNGLISEFVFEPRSYNTNDVLSRLDWQIKNIPVINFDGKVTLFKYGFLHANGFFALPKSSGCIEDYDWLNCLPIREGGFNLPQEYGTEVTNYSWHNNHLASYYGFGISVGTNFIVPIIHFRFSPYISYQYEYIAFDGTNGYKKYKAENWQKKDFSGKVISYFQEINSFLLGLDFEVPVFSHFGFSGSFSISPNATFIQALDFHYINKKDNYGNYYGTVFLDTLNSAFQLQTDATIYANINRHNKLSVSCFVQYIPTAKGNDYCKFITTDGIYIKPDDKWMQTGTNNAGTSRFLYKINLGYTYSF